MLINDDDDFDQEEAHYWMTIRDFQALCSSYGVDRVLTDTAKGLAVTTMTEGRAEMLLATVDDLRLKVLNYILWDMSDNDDDTTTTQ